MDPTLEELLRLAELLDPDDVVERLGLSSTDIVLAFSHLIKDNADKFEELERVKNLESW